MNRPLQGEAFIGIYFINAAPEASLNVNLITRRIEVCVEPLAICTESSSQIKCRENLPLISTILSTMQPESKTKTCVGVCLFWDFALTNTVEI